MEELYFKRTAYLPFSPDIALSDFFLFDWLKSELGFPPVADIDELSDVMEAILCTLIIEIIASIFTTGSKD
jgi:hypothetical protein